MSMQQESKENTIIAHVEQQLFLRTKVGPNEQKWQAELQIIHGYSNLDLGLKKNQE